MKTKYCALVKDIFVQVPMKHVLRHLNVVSVNVGMCYVAVNAKIVSAMPRLNVLLEAEEMDQGTQSLSKVGNIT